MIVPQGMFRKLPCGGGVLPNIINPLSLPGMELYLDSRLGLSSVAHGGNVATWPDQSGKARDATKDAGSATFPLMQRSGAGRSPGGQPSVLFSGVDFPNSCWLSWAAPLNTSLPDVLNGYTFYAGLHPLAPTSSSLIQLLLDGAAGGSAFRLVPEGGAGKYQYRDEITDRNSGTNFAVGDQLLRYVRHSLGTNQGTGSGTVSFGAGAPAPLTWATNTWITGNRTNWEGYALGQLAANNVVGLHGYLYWLVWFSREHTAFQQQGVENYFRVGFGFPLLTGAP